MSTVTATQTQTHNPAFKPTIKGSLSLAQLRKASQQASQGNTTIAKAVGTLKTQHKVAKAQTATRQAFRKRTNRQGKTMHSCLACGDSTTPRLGAVIAFKLANGHEGTIAGKVCKVHKAGDDWRGVGEIVTVEATATLERETGAKFFSLPLAEGKTIETPQPTVETLPALSAPLTATLALVTSEAQTVRDIAQPTKLSVGTIRKHLTKLVKLGHVVKGEIINRSGTFKLA